MSAATDKRREHAVEGLRNRGDFLWVVGFEVGAGAPEALKCVDSWAGLCRNYTA
jgi:hypothetical protein